MPGRAANRQLFQSLFPPSRQPEPHNRASRVSRQVCLRWMPRLQLLESRELPRSLASESSLLFARSLENKRSFKYLEPVFALVFSTYFGRPAPLCFSDQLDVAVAGGFAALSWYDARKFLLGYLRGSVNY